EAGRRLDRRLRRLDGGRAPLWRRGAYPHLSLPAAVAFRRAGSAQSAGTGRPALGAHGPGTLSAGMARARANLALALGGRQQSAPGFAGATAQPPATPTAGHASRSPAGPPSPPRSPGALGGGDPH